jgi:hypothetical protein
MSNQIIERGSTRSIILITRPVIMKTSRKRSDYCSQLVNHQLLALNQLKTQTLTVTIHPRSLLTASSLNRLISINGRTSRTPISRLPLGGCHTLGRRHVTTITSHRIH